MAPQEHHNEVLVEQILKAVKAEQVGDNRWRGLCPSHDDHNPSLDIYVNADGYPGFHCLSKHCKHVDIVKAIKTKFNIDVPIHKTISHDERVQNTRVLYPAHESRLPANLRRDDDTIYEYVLSSGEVAFIVQRYMEGKHKQTPAWFSVEYVLDGGRIERAWSPKNPPNKDRPIYNLFQLKLTENLKKPVLIVEGEKTADAAANYIQLKDYIITTWSGGSSRVKASDWSALRDRDTAIYLWPDNDADGIKAMKDVAKYINLGPDDQRLFLLDYSQFTDGRIDKGWDLADGCANIVCDLPFEELWKGFKPYYVSESVTSESLEEALAKRDKWYRKLNIGNKVIFLDMRYSDEQSPFGLRWTDDSRIVALRDTEKVTVEVGERFKHINVATEWCNTRGDGPTMLNNVIFDPTSNEREMVGSDGFKCLNTYPGMPEFPIEGRHEGLVKVWIEHLNGMIDELEARNWIIDFFADIVQHPAHKPGTALALLGGQGVGKSVLIQCVAAVLGTKLTRMINKDIVKYNIELVKSLLVIHDEWSINHYREKPYWEILKNAITNPRIRVEAKHIPAWESNSFCRFAFTSNDAKPIRLPPDDRRFTIVHCDRRWLNDKPHFEAIFKQLDDKTALGGFLDFLKNRKITSNLTIGYNTRQKDELWEPENKVLAELIQWADGNGMPMWMQEKLGPVTNNFGEDFILIPRSVMREYMTMIYGNHAYSNSDIAILKRITPSSMYKKRIPTFDKRGGETRTFDLYFIVPPLQEFRTNIEKELRRNYPWNDAEIRIDLEVTNVIPIKPVLKDSPV